jgi:hypothetical protein
MPGGGRNRGRDVARVPDWCLVTGAGVLWYIFLWSYVKGPFDDYWTAYGVAFTLLGVGLIGKVILGLVWLVRFVKEAR